MNRDLISYGPSGSLRVGSLSKGCVKCINGEKIVLYTTGSCSVGCAYCPIPEDRQKIDDVFINERKIPLDSNGLDTIFNESEMCLAEGVGITGGDPMEVPERTIQYIQDIRKQFGENYHLHLYTSGIFFRKKRNLIDRLFEAGLDELRFHPKQIRAYPIWEIAAETKKRFPNHSIGFEIPVIPNTEKDIEELILFADKNGLDFVNLNEYEFTSTNFNKLSQRGFVSVLSNSAIVGSKETARTVMERVKDTTSITIHFCTSGSKDSIQLVQRFKRRASQIKRPFDDVSNEGELEYGQFFVDSSGELNKLGHLLESEYELDQEMFEIFPDELKIETGWFIVEEITQHLRDNYFPNIQAEAVARHPIKNGPITYINPY
ncbi:MAG: radical SAM protein [Candidatus Heimdallarchaeota archaeon]